MNAKTFLFTFVLVITAKLATAQVDDAKLLEYYQSQRYLEAADYLKKTYAEPITDTKVLSRLAYANHMANRLADAEGYYQRVYDMDTTNHAALYSMASINLRRGNNTKAEAYYKRILLTDTTNYVVYSQLARIAGDRKDIPNTIYYLQKANKLNPADADIAANLSDYYIALKFFDKAQAVLTKAAENDPEDVVILTALSKLTSRQKKWPETIATCQKLVQLGVGSGEILSRLGVAYYQAKNFECGVNSFADIAENERNESIFYYTAMCYKALKDQKMAIFYMNKAIVDGISPNIASYYGEIADSNERLAKLKGAVAAYEKSLQFEPDAMVYYSLANLYDSKLKNKKLALKYYKKYLAANPPEKQQNFIAYTKSRITELAN